MSRPAGAPLQHVLLLVIAAAGVLQASASESCGHNGDCSHGFGAYHLSCYTANITPLDAEEAKAECIAAWQLDAPAGCTGTVEEASPNAHGCPTAVVYKFNSAACRKSYQSQEKTNALCNTYSTLGLGSAENRASTDEPSDWECQHCTGGIGSYHLSCYQASVTPSDGSSAKQQCLTAWAASATGCLFDITEAESHRYGCPTAIEYKFNTEACRNSYQAQEKTNPDCTEYVSLGLGAAANRANTTFPADWECERCNAGLGSYHLSCYQASVPPTDAGKAKEECLDAWAASAPDCTASVTEVTSNHYGCPSSVVYKFNSAECRDSYQAQEKSNAKCTGYIALGLASSANRASSYTAADWECA